MFLTERQIERAYDEIKDYPLKIAVFHHTFDWLNQNEKQIIKNRLGEKFNIVLCGHNHENTAEAISSNIGQLLSVILAVYIKAEITLMVIQF